MLINICRMRYCAQLRNIFIFALVLIIILLNSQSVYAKELCDCFGSCVSVYPRELSTKTKRIVRIRDGYKPYDYVEVDHKIPLCLGGTNNVSNLQALTPQQHKVKTEHDLLLLYYVRSCFMTIDEARKETSSWK